MNATDLPAAVEEYLRDDRAELFEFAGTLVGYDAQNPRARTTAVDHLRTDFRRREPTVDPGDERDNREVGRLLRAGGRRRRHVAGGRPSPAGCEVSPDTGGGFMMLGPLHMLMTVSVLDSYVESMERIQPNQANNYGNTHGGEMVRLMDELAAVAAMTVAGETCVTAHISSVDFRSPIPVGHVAELSAYVYDTGDSSLEVYVDVESLNPREDEAAPTTAACFTMVAVGEDGDPVEVPAVVPETDRGERLVEAAPC